ncbi:hypothetical protein EMIT0P253_180051 [Pseudomonas sp. IT-P253]|uniref:hypothetical protein n=1 Tax=Pseudomonas sp. IT-P253 TaxID=3026455 RepID=UPI0039E16FC5
MSVTIEHLSSQSERLWSVCIGTMRIQFRNEQGAKDYAAKLKERIEAPHSYLVHYRSPTSTVAASNNAK